MCDKIAEQLVIIGYTELEASNLAKKLAETLSLLPAGFKVYICSDCNEINVKRNNHEIRVGFCDTCGHPLWN